MCKRIFDEGRDAVLAEIPLEACPYPPRSNERRCWRKGYEQEVSDGQQVQWAFAYADNRNKGAGNVRKI